MMRRIAQYEVENIGPEHSQYFQGRGVSMTRFDAVYIGIGDDAKEAYEDAVESAAMDDCDVSRLPSRPRGIRKSDKLTAEEQENEDYHYHVALYVRESRRAGQ
jgi:hypothetical protein